MPLESGLKVFADLIQEHIARGACLYRGAR
jgi:hypothetical protein